MDSSRVAFFGLTVVIVASLAAAAVGVDAAAPTSEVKRQTGGGLACFEGKVDEKSSCDAACGREGAVCTGVNSAITNPPSGCASIGSASSLSCRCCRIE